MYDQVELPVCAHKSTNERVVIHGGEAKNKRTKPGQTQTVSRKNKIPCVYGTCVLKSGGSRAFVNERQGCVCVPMCKECERDAACQSQVL